MNLLEELKEKAKEYRTDSYPMSIGEIISLYKENELFINPDFQRYFRWSDQQKSRFIESILLGIPTPSIFVYQREDGVWELVDGLQRISTILEFLGILKGEDGETKPLLELKGTTILSSLQGVKWENPEDREHSLPTSLQIHFKRSKIQIQIIQKESDADAKYEVFERLNTGCSSLSYQEVRNCLLIMINKNLHSWLLALSKNENFQTCISLSDRLIDERYDMELVLRYIACSSFPFDNGKEVNQYLTDLLKEIARNPSFNIELEERKFCRLFSLLNAATGEGTFKKYDGQRFKGQFLESAYEAITVGLGANLDNYSERDDSDVSILREKIQNMWSDDNFTSYIGADSNASGRIPRMIEFGRKHFQK